MVVEYKYDAWGKPVSVRTLTTAYDALASLNPFRYRGYIWDEETGWYYLRSRYYNPEWGRFINADTLLGKTGGLLSHNAFTYCENNVIKSIDPDGFMTISDAELIPYNVGGGALVTYPSYDYGYGGTALSGSSIATDTNIVVAVEETAIVLTAATIAEDYIEKKNRYTYSVYFLKDKSGRIKYVGRVTDHGYDARMNYHKNTRGLTPAYRVSGLTYIEARGLEEIGMIECHTINRMDWRANQIHGISPANTHGYIYMQSAFSYIENKADQFLLNFLK